LGGVSIQENYFGIDWKAIVQEVKTLDSIHLLGVPDVDRNVDTLSGGNIQRVILSRAMVKIPRLMLASYPTRGLDIGTVMTVHKILLQLKQEGCAILLVSEDLGELFDLSDRIGIIADSVIYGPYSTDEISQTEAGNIMLGGSEQAKKINNPAASGVCCSRKVFDSGSKPLVPPQGSPA
jgi:simple sugar transport system ATP-binding protein